LISFINHIAMFIANIVIPLLFPVPTQSVFKLQMNRSSLRVSYSLSDNS